VKTTRNHEATADKKQITAESGHPVDFPRKSSGVISSMQPYAASVSHFKRCQSQIIRAEHGEVQKTAASAAGETKQPAISAGD
jgi:hypothetical protein